MFNTQNKQRKKIGKLHIRTEVYQTIKREDPQIRFYGNIK